ncbi:MAG: pantoate--beta-alanine ligase [Bacilli bacterium]|nr:pantoate--beta-alanine ligase [Bacilli bacterium]
MKVIQTVHELRTKIYEMKRQKQNGAMAADQIIVGFVPTMGFLHAGHASLLQRARRECEIVVLSIFVNPLQFGPNEDFERYPRDPEKDLALAEQCEVDFVFMPETAEMYPQPMKTKVIVAELTDTLCGASRPGHFDGVATVVAKLLNIVEPDKAYFGLKDAQQVAVITQMVEDLHIRSTIVPCPIVREEDGLAMSSRNVYLSAEQRKQALILSQALQNADQWLAEDNNVDALEKRIRNFIQTAPLAEIDYVKALYYPSMQENNHLDQQLLIAVAVKFGRTRLIDNRLIELNR